MASKGVNKAFLIGNLGVEPDVRHLPSGGQVTNIRIATTEKWRDKQTNEVREDTEWHRVVFFGKLAEIAGQYLNKGSQVYVEGKIKTRKWQGQDGQDRYTTEIVANELQMLGGKPQNGSGRGAQGQGGYGQGGAPGQAGGGYPDQGQGGYQHPPTQGQVPPSQGGGAQAGNDQFGEDDIPF